MTPQQHSPYPLFCHGIYRRCYQHGTSHSIPALAALLSALLVLFLVGANPAFAIAPGAPTFGTQTLVATPPTWRFTQVVVAPALPAGAGSLILQRKEPYNPDTSYSAVATGLAGNASTSVTGLIPNRRYVFRYVNTNTGEVGPSRIVDMGSAPPDQANAVTFDQLTATGVRVTVPAKPTGATHLSLQMKPAGGTYSNVQTNLQGGEVITATYPGSPPVRNHSFRIVAFGPHGQSDGIERQPTTRPDAPVIFPGTLTNSSFSTELPSIEGTNWDSAGLQSTDDWAFECKRNGEPDSAYQRLVGGGWGSYLLFATQRDIYNLAPGTTYLFRWTVRGVSGLASGPTTTVTTLGGTSSTDPPGEPDYPRFPAGGIQPYSVQIQAPATLPARTGSFRLQIAAWSDVPGATGLGVNAITTYSGLAPNTTYKFRYVAISPDGTKATAVKWGEVTTASDIPGKPGTVSFSSIGQNSLTATLPPLPYRTSSLKLQMSTDAVGWTDKATGLVGGAVVPVTGLTANTNYYFRCVAMPVSPATEDTEGDVSGVTTAGPPPPVPPAPSLTLVAYDAGRPQDWPTITVSGPSQPTDTTSLTLQALVVGQPGAAYANVPVDIIFAGLTGPVPVEMQGFTPGNTYRFRYVANGPNGTTTGTATTDVAVSAITASWQTSGTLGTPIQCDGIRRSEYTGGKLYLSSFLATDWDERAISLGGGNTIRVRQGDPCVYYWNVKQGGVNVGSFVDGVNRAQSAVWTPPGSGTYTVELTVTDQDGGNKSAGEGGDRNDANRGTWDAPLLFSKTVTIP